MLSAHDLAYVAAIAANNEGNSDEWFSRASQFRRLAPNDPFALNEFAEAAFANNYYRAADSASTALQGLRGWPSQMISMLYAQVDARHNAGDFAGALETLQTIAARLPSAPFPC